MLRAIVFDFDGVIANSEPLHFALTGTCSPARRRPHRGRLLRALPRLRRSRAHSRRLPRDRGARLDGRADCRADPAARPAARGTRSGQARCSVPRRGGRDSRGRERVPIAIASGALGVEIRRVLDRENLTQPLHRDRRGRGHAGEQARAGSVPAGRGQAVGGARPTAAGRVCRGRGLAVGPGIGSRCRAENVGGRADLRGRSPAAGRPRHSVHAGVRPGRHSGGSSSPRSHVGSADQREWPRRRALSEPLSDIGRTETSELPLNKAGDCATSDRYQDRATERAD